LTGIGRYAWELAQAIQTSPDVEEARYLGYRGVQSFEELSTLVARQSAPRTDATVTLSQRVALSAQVRRWLINYRIVSIAFQAKQRFEYHRNLADAGGWVVHGPNYHLPEKVPKRTLRVVTVHDLSTFIEPQWHPSERVRRMDSILPKALAVADCVIADASSCAESLVANFSVDRARIRCVPLGVDHSFFLRGADIRETFALCVSTIEPRKNIGTLLRAYQSLPLALRRASPLVLVGEYGWRSADEHDAIRHGVAQGWLTYLGYVDEATLVSLYHRARLCVYPSLHEGFGLPVLEAFAAGTPVIAGNHSSIPEVAGGHAHLLADISDVDALREAIASELNAPWDDAVAQTRIDHARQYTWARTAALTLDAYRGVLSS
jgi:glycosyltransferase involved in cell wall biosynthesis